MPSFAPSPDCSGRYTPPHLRSPEPRKICTSPPSDHTRPNTQISPPIPATKTHSPPRSPGLLARGNPLWSEIADEELLTDKPDTDPMQICLETVPQPAPPTINHHTSLQNQNHLIRSPPSPAESTQSNSKARKDLTTKPVVSTHTTSSHTQSRKGKEIAPDNAPVDSEWHREVSKKTPHSPSHLPWRAGKDMTDHVKPRSQAPSSATSIQSEAKSTLLGTATSSSYLQKDSVDPLDHP
jgi:hypothetical protein